MVDMPIQPTNQSANVHFCHGQKATQGQLLSGDISGLNQEFLITSTKNSACSI